MVKLKNAVKAGHKRAATVGVIPAHGSFVERVSQVRAQADGSGDPRTIYQFARRVDPRLRTKISMPVSRRGEWSGSDVRDFSNFAGYMPREHAGGVFRRSLRKNPGAAGLTSGYSRWAPPME